MNLASSLSATVVDPTRAPESGAHLRFSLVQGQDDGEATTDDDGTFKATAMSGGGDYMFEVRAMATSPRHGARKSAVPSPTMTVSG